MLNFITRWLVHAAGFLAAIVIVPGITLTHTGQKDLIAIVLITGLINSVLGPLFKFFTFPFVLLTMGLWLWVVNMIMFWFAGYLGKSIGFGFTVNGFWPVFFGAIIVSLVSTIFGNLLINNRKFKIANFENK